MCVYFTTTLAVKQTNKQALKRVVHRNIFTVCEQSLLCVFIALFGWRNLSFGRLSAKKMGCIKCVFVLIVCRRQCSAPPCPLPVPRARHTWISSQWKNNKFILSHQKSEYSPPLKSGKKMYACVDKICHSHYFNNSSACAPFFFL